MPGAFTVSCLLHPHLGSASIDDTRWSRHSKVAKRLVFMTFSETGGRNFISMGQNQRVRTCAVGTQGYVLRGSASYFTLPEALGILFETETPDFLHPKFLTLQCRINGRLCCLRRVPGRSIFRRAICTAVANSLGLWHICDRKTPRSVLLFLPPLRFLPSGVVWFKPRHTFQVRVCRNLRLPVSLRSLLQRSVY